MLQLEFSQPKQSFKDNPYAEGVYFKRNKDWIYAKVEKPHVCFHIPMEDLKDIDNIISTFKMLNPRFNLTTVKYINNA